jgi:hypothetical protein
MKTFTLLFISFFISITFAKADGNSCNIQQDIQSKIAYPGFAKACNEQGTVLVKILISENGQIKIAESNSDNVVLQQWLIKQLSVISLQDSEYFNTEHYMKFNFRLI